MRVAIFDPKHFGRLADGLAVALAISLPWSTSATGIIATLWLLALIPTLDFLSLRRVIYTPAGGFPVLLLLLGIAGMFWADVSWADRLHGVSSFIKLLFIPLLLHRFCRSDAGRHVLIGFVSSCVLLLVVSWSLWAWPAIPWPLSTRSVGIPVKDYIAQSAMFTVCALVLVRFAHDMWRNGRRHLSVACIMLVVFFLLNVFYIAPSRTYLVVIPVLLFVFGSQVWGWKGAIGLVLGFLVLAMAAWPSATYLRSRVGPLYDEIRSYQPSGKPTPAGERLEYWRKSVAFMQEAPLFGHGTGSISELFRSVAGQTGMAAEVANNPHNQMLAVGIQIGLVGIAALLAMWIAHLALFRYSSFAAWVGLVVVIQNIIGSLFNSHLFDFTHGWTYVVGVGIAGGTVLKETAFIESVGRPSAINH